MPTAAGFRLQRGSHFCMSIHRANLREYSKAFVSFSIFLVISVCGQEILVC